METKIHRFNYSQAALVREKGMKAGREYCSKWMSSKGRAVPVCKRCGLVKHGRDCKGNPVGFRDFLMASERAKLADAILSTTPLQTELKMKIG